MKKISPLLWILFAAGFLAGVVFFFPLDALRATVLSAIRDRTRIDLSAKSIYVSTGLNLGPRRGSLIALKADDVLITLPDSNTLKCDDLVIAPGLFPLLYGRLSVALRCRSRQSGELLVQAWGSPFWAPQKFQVTTILDNANLALAARFMPQLSAFSGLLSGEIHIQDFEPGRTQIPNAEWELTGQEVQSPPLTSDFFNLPALDMGQLKVVGSMESRKVSLKELSFGSAKTSVEVKVAANLTLDPRGMPSDGDLSGKIRTDPGFEKIQLKDINMDLSFGKVKESGFREFRKKMEGGPQSLLFNPPLDK